MPAYGPSPAGRRTTFNTPGTHSGTGASTGAGSGAGAMVIPPMATMQHLNKLIKGIKDTNEADKLYFTGEGINVGAKFLQWFTMLADEAVVYDTNLGPYFSISLGTAEEEHELMEKGASYDHFVFHYIKRFCKGPAALLAESLKGIGSGRALVLDLVSSFMTNFSGEVKQIQRQMDEVVFPEGESPQGAILRLQYLYSKLLSLQKARGKAVPDESDVCLDVIHRLPSGTCYDELKHYESSQPLAPELRSLFSLRTFCQSRFNVWMQNVGHLRQGKRTLAAAQAEEEEDDCYQDDVDEGELCYAGDGNRYPSSRASGKGGGKGGKGGKGAKQQKFRNSAHRDAGRGYSQHQQHNSSAQFAGTGNPNRNSNFGNSKFGSAGMFGNGLNRQNQSNRKQCLFCKVMLMAGKQLDRNNMFHRYSQCPSLPRDLQSALKAYEGSLVAGMMQELGETELPEEFGFSGDFNVETDGWGDAQADGQDELSDPRNNHPLARAAKLSQFNDGDIVP